MNKKRGLSRGRFASASLAFFVSLAHAIVFFVISRETFELIILDHWFRYDSYLEQEKSADPAPEVVIVTLDSESVEKLPDRSCQNLSRKYYAELIERLRDAGAKRVAFDLVFKGKGETPQHDEEFEQALSLMPVVLGCDVVPLPDRRFEVSNPDSKFAKNAEALGFINLVHRDLLVRKFGLSFPGAPLRALSEVAIGTSALKFGRPGPYDYIRYYGPPGSIRTIPLYRALDKDDRVVDEMVTGKIVFVGPWRKIMAQDSRVDSFRTPYGKETFGVELHATAAVNLLRGDWIKRSAPETEAIILLVVVFLAASLLVNLSPPKAWLLWAALTAGWLLASFGCFKHGWFLPGATASLFLFILVAANSLRHFLAARREKRWIEETFGKFTSRKVVDWLKEDPARVREDVYSANLATLFSDIKGFTKWTDSVSAELIRPLICRHAEVFEQCLEEEGGTYIGKWGDGDFAIWGAPRDVQDASTRAILCALRLRERLSALSSEEGLPELPTRIGVHEGASKVGNFGSSKRFHFTAYGSVINLTSRIESLNKAFGTTLLVTEHVLSNASVSLETFFLGKVVCAGTSEPVGIYTIFETASPPSEAKALWSKALELFRERSWKDALKAFEEIKETEQRLSKAAASYIYFIGKYSISLPIPNWAGELIFESKDSVTAKPWEQ